jgi:hypothetical protein
MAEIKDSMPKAEGAGQLKQTSVIIVVLLTLLTSGIYFPIWFLTRRSQFNSLQSGEKLGTGIFVFSIVAFSAAVILSLYSGLAVFFQPLETSAGQGPILLYADLIANIITLIAIIPLIQQTFKVKRILHDHYHGHLKQEIHLSTILTLLLLNIYLQYKINALPRDERA